MGSWAEHVSGFIKISIPILLISFTVLLYGNTLDAEFHFDDYAYIIESSEVSNIGYCLENLYHHFFRPDRMLVTLSFALNYHFHGLALPGYHIVNIFIHALNGVILYLLLLRVLQISGSKEPEHSQYMLSGTVSLLFLAHPVAVNSVTYITQRHVLAATLFYLLGILFYLQARSCRSPFRFVYLTAVVVSYWCAIHSKQMALTLPLTLLMTEWVLIKKAALPPVKWLLRSVLPIGVAFSLILIAYSVESDLFSSSSQLAGFRSESLWSPWQHVMTESIVFLHYWKILLLPWPGWLSADHYFPVSLMLDKSVIISWLLHAVILLGIVLALKKNYVTGAFGGLFFYMTLIPPYLALPIVDVMVDYKTYLPSVGLMFIFAEVGRVIIKRAGVVVLALTCGAILLTYSAVSIERNSVFRTEITFWSDVISKYPEQARPYNNRGLAYLAAGEYDQAIGDFSQAIKLDSEYSLAYANLGDGFLAVNDLASALDNYEKYSGFFPEDANGYVRIANVHGMMKDWQRARELYSKAVKLDRYNVGAIYNLGLAYGQLGETDKAKKMMHRVLKLKPDHLRSISTLGSIYLVEGSLDQAIKYFLEALEINPLHGDSLYNLAVSYIKQGKPDDARRLAKQLEPIDKHRSELIMNYIER